MGGVKHEEHEEKENSRWRSTVWNTAALFGARGRFGRAGTHSLSQQGPEPGANREGQVRLLHVGQGADRIRSHGTADSDSTATEERSRTAGCRSWGRSGCPAGSSGWCAIAGDAGKGAAIGAASGGVMGGMRRQDQVRQQEQVQERWAQEQAAQYAQKRNHYNRAYGACLEGKGYTVK